MRNAAALASPAPVTVQLNGWQQGGATVTASGTGWVCNNNAQTCTTSASVAPGASLPALTAVAEVFNQPGSTLQLSAGLTTPDANGLNDRVNSTIPVRGSGTRDVVVTLTAPSAPFVVGAPGV